MYSISCDLPLQSHGMPKNILNLILIKTLKRIASHRDGNLVCFKEIVHVINGKKVQMDIAMWDLTKDAVPTIFPNIPKLLVTTVT